MNIYAHNQGLFYGSQDVKMMNHTQKTTALVDQHFVY